MHLALTLPIPLAANKLWRVASSVCRRRRAAHCRRAMLTTWPPAGAGETLAAIQVSG